MPLWVDFLGLAGIEAAHWASVGKRDAPDTDIMAYAAAKDDIVLTHDLDFGAILAATNGAKAAAANKCVSTPPKLPVKTKALSKRP